MTTTGSLASFQEEMRRSYISHPLADLLTPFRQRAWERYQEVSHLLPKRLFSSLLEKELSLAERPSIPKEQIQAMIPSAFKNSVIVFVDGFLAMDVCDLTGLKGMLLLPLNQAMQSYGIVLQNRLLRSLKEEKDPIALLNMAFCQEGAFLYLSPNQTASGELLILHVLTGQEGALSAPRVQLFLGKGSSLTTSTLFVSLEQYQAPCFYNALVDVLLEEDAALQFHSLATDATPVIFEAFRGSLKRGTRCNLFAFTGGNNLVRRNYQVAMLEEESFASLNGLSLLRGSSESVTEVEVKHLAERCTSHQLFKGVLFDGSKCSFTGKIYVAPIAQQTESYQLNKNLLLSDQAVATSQPELEILADDVKASHGATVGALDQEELFYLQARGVSKEIAEALLIQGFCSELLSSVSPFVKEKMYARLEELC